MTVTLLKILDISVYCKNKLNCQEFFVLGFFLYVEEIRSDALARKFINNINFVFNLFIHQTVIASQQECFIIY